MFLEDELEYVRLKRNDNIMGWLAIVFVAALVFMFAGLMNSASATGASPAHIAEARQNAGVGSLFLPSPHVTSHVAASQPLFVEVASRDVPSAEAASQPADAMFQTVALNDADANETSFAQAGQELALAISKQASAFQFAQSAGLADHDILNGLLLVSVAFIGGSFILLTFGGPRGSRDDEDRIDVL